MNEFIAVLAYTFKENMRKKAFIISTIIILVLTIIVVSLPGIINAFDSRNKSKSSTVEASKQEKKGIIYVVDSKNIFKNDMEKIKKAFVGYSFMGQSIADVENLKKRVSKEDDKALLVIDEKGGEPIFNYYIKTYGKGLSPDDISADLKRIFVSRTLKEANVSDAISLKVQGNISYNVMEMGKSMMSGYLPSIIISMLLFFAIYFFGYGVSMSVASEKTSRVMEILVTSTKPLKIVLGKSVAMGLLGLCQLSSIILATVVTYKLTFPKNFTLDGQKIDFSSFTPLTIFMVIVYFILGYSLYAMMNAVAGATVSKAEDINSAIMPISMISMISFYFAYFTLMSPKGTIAVVASLIPFSAPFSMPCRIISTDVPLWQILTSLSILVVSILVIAWLSIKIYSSAVLHYGKRLKIKDLIARIS